VFYTTNKGKSNIVLSSPKYQVMRVRIFGVKASHILDLDSVL